MKIFHFVLPCIMALLSTCSLAGSGFLIDNQQVSQVYICTQNKSQFKENISIKVKTGDEEIRIVPTVNYGYEPSVFLGDFIGNGLNQIFYWVNSGGSGAYSSSQVISLQNGKQITIYDSENFKNTAKVELRDNLVQIKYLNNNYYLDASFADLSENKNVYISDVTTVMPVYNGGLGKYQIMQFQKVYIDYTANNIGYLTSIIDLTLDGWNIVSVGTLSNFGY